MNRLGKFGTGLEAFSGLLLQRALQDFPHLLLHRAPIPRRAHFQVTLRAFVQLSDSDTRHDCNDIIAIIDCTIGIGFRRPSATSGTLAITNHPFWHFLHLFDSTASTPA